MDKEKAVADLLEIVKQFNKEFDMWTITYDARVQFGWGYGKPGEQAKKMEIQAIDQIIYRKPPPASLTEIMDANKSAKSTPSDAV